MIGFLSGFVNTGNGLVNESYDYDILNLLMLVECLFLC